MSAVRGLAVFLVGACLIAGAAPVAAQAPVGGGEAASRPLPPPFAPDQVLVAFRPGLAGAEVAQAHAAAGARVLKRFAAIGVELVAVPAGSVQATMAFYQRNPNVRYAEPNYYRPLVLPTEGRDPPDALDIDYFTQQWGLHNTGQALFDPATGGTLAATADADIDAPEAWDLTRGSDTVRIAILDSGVECTHVDLATKCLEQKNFTGSSTAADLIGHGTDVAAIAAAETNNRIGTAGVGWNAKFGSIKVCREYPYEWYPILGMCEVADSVEGLLYAADNGYHVVNMSYGSDPDPYSPSNAERDAIAYAWSKGLVLVAAAGNDYASKRHYPAAFAEVISVAATDRHDNLAYFSTFDKNWVSVAAPGHQILSAYPNAGCGIAADDPEGCYNWLSGTSMASPHVAGVAALVRAYDPGLSNAEVRSRIESGADASGALGQNFRAWVKYGRVNAHRALGGGAEPPLPPSPISLSATGSKVKGVQQADLQWSGASTAVDIWRNGATIATNEPNDGAYRDAIGQKGTGSHTYRVCATGTTVCSNEATVSF